MSLDEILEEGTNQFAINVVNSLSHMWISEHYVRIYMAHGRPQFRRADGLLESSIPTNFKCWYESVRAAVNFCEPYEELFLVEFYPDAIKQMLMGIETKTNQEIQLFEFPKNKHTQALMQLLCPRKLVVRKDRYGVEYVVYKFDHYTPFIYNAGSPERKRAISLLQCTKGDQQSVSQALATLREAAKGCKYDEAALRLIRKLTRELNKGGAIS